MNFLIAQENGLEIIISQDSILAGNKFELTYKLKNVQAQIIDIPNLDKFRVISGPNHSSQMTIVNGAMSSESALSFVLMAQEEGVFEMPLPVLDSEKSGLSFPKKYLTVLPNPDNIKETPHNESIDKPNIPKKRKTKRKLYRI